MKDTLNKLYSLSIEHTQLIYQLAKKLDCLDSQEFINWQDSLNEISVLYE